MIKSSEEQIPSSPAPMTSSPPVHGVDSPINRWSNTPDRSSPPLNPDDNTQRTPTCGQRSTINVIDPGPGARDALETQRITNPMGFDISGFSNALQLAHPEPSFLPPPPHIYGLGSEYRNTHARHSLSAPWEGLKHRAVGSSGVGIVYPAGPAPPPTSGLFASYVTQPVTSADPRSERQIHLLNKIREIVTLNPLPPNRVEEQVLPPVAANPRTEPHARSDYERQTRIIRQIRELVSEDPRHLVTSNVSHGRTNDRAYSVTLKVVRIFS